MMEIIKDDNGWYIQIDLKGIGFAESKWYLTEARLVMAVLNNNIEWHFIDRKDI